MHCTQCDYKILNTVTQQCFSIVFADCYEIWDEICLFDLQLKVEYMRLKSSTIDDWMIDDKYIIIQMASCHVKMLNIYIKDSGY